MLRLKARAKVNWSLDILGTRADGYHLMDMLMESVELADDLSIAPANALTLTVSGACAPAGGDNLIIKAALELQSAFGCKGGAQITLVKRIPAGAGMGGGSADAAAALVGLNRLWNLRATDADLARIALSVGADVPFMLMGGLARAGGIGEHLMPLRPTRRAALVAVQPCQPLSTREVFAAYDTLACVRHPDTARAETALLFRDYDTLSAAAGNVLAQASEQARPQIAEAVEALRATGAEFAAMTGSGSAVFGAFADGAAAQGAFKALKKRWRRCWLTQTAEEGIVVEGQDDNYQEG